MPLGPPSETSRDTLDTPAGLDRLHPHLHVRGCKKADVIDRVPGPAVRAAALRQRMVDVRYRHHDWIRAHGADLPEVAEWTWRQ